MKYIVLYFQIWDPHTHTHVVSCSVAFSISWFSKMYHQQFSVRLQMLVFRFWMNGPGFYQRLELPFGTFSCCRHGRKEVEECFSLVLWLAGWPSFDQLWTGPAMEGHSWHRRGLFFSRSWRIRSSWWHRSVLPRSAINKAIWGGTLGKMMVVNKENNIFLWGNIINITLISSCLGSLQHISAFFNQTKHLRTSQKPEDGQRLRTVAWLELLKGCRGGQKCQKKIAVGRVFERWC